VLCPGPPRDPGESDRGAARGIGKVTSDRRKRGRKR
jgi:hypothetical protein